MRTEEEIQEFYSRELEPALRELEGRRKAVLKRHLFAALAVLGATALTGLIVYVVGSNPVPVVIVFIVAAVVAGFVVTGPTKAYKQHFKDAIIRRVVAFLGEDLHYEPHGLLSESTFLSAKIFTQSPDRFQGDDLVRGRIDKTEVEFSELHAEYKTTSTDSKGRSRTTWHTIFRGLFFIADFHKDFQGTTVVLPDTAERLFGGFGKMLQSWSFGRGELVKLEDPEFERLFVVYGDDQVEARYILSPSLMERITDFKKRSNRRIHLSFVRSRVFVAVSYTRELFEPRLFRSVLGFDSVAEYFEDLQLALGIVEDLNLNTRIWSKE